MKRGPAVSPVLAGTIIVIAVAVLGFFIVKMTGGNGKVQLSPDQVKQMQQMQGQGPSGPGGGRMKVSAPPGVPK